MAEIKVPVVLEPPDKKSEDRVVESARRIAAEERKVQAAANQAKASAAAQAEKALTAVVGREQAVRLRAATEAAARVTQDTNARFKALRDEQEESTALERRAADAAVITARATAGQMNAIAHERAVAEGRLRDVVLQTYAEQEEAARDIRDVVAEYSWSAYATTIAENVGQAAADIKGYTREMSVAFAAWALSMVAAADKYFFAWSIVSKSYKTARFIGRGISGNRPCVRRGCAGGLRKHEVHRRRVRESGYKDSSSDSKDANRAHGPRLTAQTGGRSPPEDDRHRGRY